MLQKELERWVRATRYKAAASNTIIRYPTIIVYSICLLDQSDFESIGREMRKGNGVDGSKAKAGQIQKKHDNSNSNQSLLHALNDGTKLESRMAALRLILEFGTAAQKAEAMKEAQAIAFENKKRESDDTIALEDSEGENDDEDDSDTETTWNT